MLFTSVYFCSKTLTVADLFDSPEHECQYSYLLNSQCGHIMLILEPVQESAAKDFSFSRLPAVGDGGNNG